METKSGNSSGPRSWDCWTLCAAKVGPRRRRKRETSYNLAASQFQIGGTTFLERTEERIERRRTGRLQDKDLDVPRRTVSLEEMDRAVAHHYHVDGGLLSGHGRKVGIAKSMAVELAAQLADLSGRAIGEH